MTSCAFRCENKIGYWHLNNHRWEAFPRSLLHFVFRITVRDSARDGGGGGGNGGGIGCIWPYRKYCIHKNLADHIKQCERKLSFWFLPF